jgi:Xaa-Pro aminopeptidase
MSEVTNKIQNLRALMKAQNIQGLRLKGVDWFAWATGGGNSVVIFTSEQGIAEVFITADRAMVLTNQIERDRLAHEEVPDTYEVIAFPWENPHAADGLVQEMLAGGTCASDRPGPGEKSLSYDFQVLKMTMGTEERERYRKVGRLAAEAMTEAITKAQSDWTEYQLAGEGAKACWQRGLDPTLVMVGSERRIQIYRHPIAGPDKLGGYAMMVFCARGFGLYANLTRFIFFREPTAAERERFAKVAQVEAAIFAASTAGTPLTAAYQTLAQAYKALGVPEEIHKHHQGGPTGYLSREFVASSFSPGEQKLQSGMALAWNPSLPGAKIEDTVLTTDKGIEILTVDPTWPTVQVAGRARPDVWIKK